LALVVFDGAEMKHSYNDGRTQPSGLKPFCDPRLLENGVCRDGVIDGDGNRDVAVREWAIPGFMTAFALPDEVTPVGFEFF
jgi:hypothetical protein